MRHRRSAASYLTALLHLGGVLVYATQLDELCEVTAREERGSSPSSALLQKERSRSLQSLAQDVDAAAIQASVPAILVDVKHPDLTDGALPWKPDLRTTQPPAERTPTSAAPPSTVTTSTAAPTTSTAASTASNASASNASASNASASNASNATMAKATNSSTTVFNLSSVSNMSSTGNESGGCCFSFGFGRNMEPCCLKSKMVMDRSYCPEADALGSRTSFSSGKCPTTPEEAAGLAEAAGDILNKECTPGNSCGEGVLPKDRGLCIKPAEGYSTCWDICDTSHMPEEYTLGDGDEDFAKKLAQAVQDVRDGKYAELSCPVEGNVTVSGDSLEEQLAAAATEASQADSMADEATVLAEQMLAEARNDFAKAMSDGATPDNLAAVAKKWEDAAAAHTKAYAAAASTAESIKALSQLLARASSRAAKELAGKKQEAKEKEAVARRKKELAAQKRLEAEEAKELAMKALAEAQKAKAEVNASKMGSIDVVVGSINATLKWNTSSNASSQAAAPKE